MAFIREIYERMRTPALVKRYYDAAVGLALIIGVQLISIPTQIALDLHMVNLPTSILVLFLVLITMTTASACNGNVDRFYNERLRGPTDFLGRHMSFGFVAFFVLLIRDHIDNASDIPKLAGVFVVTTIISYVASFSLAYWGFLIEHRLRRSQRMANDVEYNGQTWLVSSTAWPASSCEQRPKLISRSSTLNKAILAKKEPLVEITLARTSPRAAFIDFVLRTAPICIWLFLLITVGFPVYIATDYMMPFEVFLFSLFWVLTLQFQRGLRSYRRLLRVPRLRPFVLILANPLVLTWALATIYMWAKIFFTRRDINTIIGEFRHYNSLAQSILHIIQDHDVPAHLGAGDLAGVLLDAGVACLGFKMYEYRSELWASLGTVSFTCTALAAINVFLNVLVGHGFGLEAKEAIAFAGRSATLALGIPAIQSLGGSATLTSTIAIFSGIFFQMAGDLLFYLMRINDTVARDTPKQTIEMPIPGKNSELFSPTVVTISTDAEDSNDRPAKFREESGVVAAGVTVGINAAAMGTAYLIERDSRATAYSALSMIVFGAATVALTALPGVAAALLSVTSK